jgi:hypothetical protein
MTITGRLHISCLVRKNEFMGRGALINLESNQDGCIKEVYAGSGDVGEQHGWRAVNLYYVIYQLFTNKQTKCDNTQIQLARKNKSLFSVHAR